MYQVCDSVKNRRKGWTEEQLGRKEVEIGCNEENK